MVKSQQNRIEFLTKPVVLPQPVRPQDQGRQPANADPPSQPARAGRPNQDMFRSGTLLPCRIDRCPG